MLSEKVLFWNSVLSSGICWLFVMEGDDLENFEEQSFSETDSEICESFSFFKLGQH